VSRVVRIRGKLKVENLQIAEEAIRCFNYSGIRIENDRFLFNEYDYYDGFNKRSEIADVEKKYKELLESYYEQFAIEKQTAELARLEEIKRIEEEHIRREKERKALQEEKRNIIIENAKKQGYRVKKEITKENKIKLVLQKRIY
jgi:hypothetical protein